MPKNIGHHGGHGPVIPPVELFNKLYGELRAQLLSRHFAIGRYFRADHLCFRNYLGVVQQTKWPANEPPVVPNDILHNCLWSDAVTAGKLGTDVMQPGTYANADAVLAMPSGPGQPGDQLFERWRVGDHFRDNPLMYSGQLMVCLAVESALGIPGSLDILSRLLSTTKSLFKFPSAPFNGYILRWDAVTTDHWTTIPRENAQSAKGDAEGGSKEEEQQQWMLDHCCDFFPITDLSAPDGYLYSTPLDDPRYTAYMASSDFGALSSAQQSAYFAARIVSLYQNRYWEPSQDELTGYVAGLSFVSAVVSDPAIKAEVSSQAALVGGWLSANAYILVRPNGGFVAQGAAGIGSAIEFPFGRVFTRLTGSSFAATTGFVGALKNAGLWQDFSAGFATATIAGIAVGAVLATLGGSFLTATLMALFGGGIAIIAAQALVLYLNAESFDVFAWPGNSNQQTQFALAYVISLIVPSMVRFISWITAAGLGIGKFSENFPPFIGLSAFGDTVTTVRNAYLRWFSMRGGNSPAPASFPLPGFDDGTTDFPNSADPFATAVAVLLGRGVSEQTKLVALLTDLANEFSSAREEQLALFDDNSQAPYFFNNTSLVDEPIRPALNYMAAVALAWFFSTLPTTNKSSLPKSFPSPPAAGTNLPAVTIPSGVVENSFGFPTSQQVIPLSGLPPLPNPLPPEIDLFADAPNKPVKPPAPLKNTTWLVSSKKSHYGGFGGSGTDPLNAGQMLSTPGCAILGVKLFLIDKHGNPLGGVPTSVALGHASQRAGVPPWPSPKAITGVWPFRAWARIVSIGTTPADMTVNVQWRYATGVACRYQIAYLVQGQNCSL